MATVHTLPRRPAHRYHRRNRARHQARALPRPQPVRRQQTRGRTHGCCCCCRCCVCCCCCCCYCCCCCLQYEAVVRPSVGGRAHRRAPSAHRPYPTRKATQTCEPRGATCEATLDRSRCHGVDSALPYFHPRCESAKSQALAAASPCQARSLRGVWHLLRGEEARTARASGAPRFAETRQGNSGKHQPGRHRRCPQPRTFARRPSRPRCRRPNP